MAGRWSLGTREPFWVNGTCSCGSRDQRGIGGSIAVELFASVGQSCFQDLCCMGELPSTTMCSCLSLRSLVDRTRFDVGRDLRLRGDACKQKIDSR